ncbi:hypothetical protein LzC2_28700 [Planctomycetes bacterium LzC2]|uniref:Uncharacterized protein n=1 Tax=Alienimonas chondri TaxID=2681879 RepID=A0ABX1VG96_9PLAN|nr:hypothetical protein [Alienimonas chondri]
MLAADDSEFFPEESEAEADGLVAAPPAAAVVNRTPEPAMEPETPTLDLTPPEPTRDAVASTADLRIADERVAPPAAAVAEQADTPFTGLSLDAPAPAAPRTAEAPEPQLAAAPAPPEESFEAPSEPMDDDEADWDLALAAATPTEEEEAPAPVEPEASPAPSLAAAEPAPETTDEAVPPTEAPGRPDPTKLLEKLAARADRSLLMGFCPVTLRDDRDLAEGNDRFTAEFEGVAYRFASAAARDKFLTDPGRYAPAAGGRDLVIASTGWGETVGSLAHAAWYRGRLYLFASRESMRRFVTSPSDYLGS